MNLRDEIKSFYYSNALCDLRLMNEKIDDKNLTYNSLLYLEIINLMDGKCTVSKLAEMLNISKPGVTLKINELCKYNYVTKTHDTKDKRKIYLSVNTIKCPLFKVYDDQDNEAIKQIEKEFNKEDIEKLCRMLQILTNININQR